MPLIKQKFVLIYLTHLILASITKSYLSFPFTRLSSLPEAPAAIDWNFYKTTVANRAMVDDFEKKVSPYILTLVQDVLHLEVKSSFNKNIFDTFIYYKLQVYCILLAC